MRRSEKKTDMMKKKGEKTREGETLNEQQKRKGKKRRENEIEV